LPVTWIMDAAHGLVRVRYTEPYTFEEWRDAVDALVADPTFLFRRQISVLVDRSSVGPLSETFTAAVAAHLAQRPRAMRGRRVVFVVADKESAAVAWQQALMCEDAGAIATVFRSQRDAEDWLRGF
jgi:hypothetical protein